MLESYLFRIVALFGLACLGMAGDGTEIPAPSVTVNMGDLMISNRGGPESSNMELEVTLKVSGKLPWSVAYCDSGAIRLKLVDSEGTGTSQAEIDYSESSDRQRAQCDGVVCVSSSGWLPSAKATWVRVHGSVPLVMSQKDELSESVSIPLKPGASVPLILKNAVLTTSEDKPGDVKTELVVEEYRDDESKDGVKWVVLKLKSSVRLGWRDFEITTAAGDPFVGEVGSRGYSRGEGSYSWSKGWRSNVLEGDHLKVSVRYTAGLKQVMVPVDMQAGLFGVTQAPVEEKSNQ